MKTIVKVLRYKDNAARLYTLPEGTVLAAGTLVRVPYPDSNSTCDGVTISDSYEVDENAEKMVAQFHRINPPTLDNLKMVVSIYVERPVEVKSDDEDKDISDSEDQE